MEPLDPNVEREIANLAVASEDRELTEAEIARLSELLSGSREACRFLAELTWQRQETATLGSKPLPRQELLELVELAIEAEGTPLCPVSPTHNPATADAVKTTRPAPRMGAFLGGALAGALAACLALLAWLPREETVAFPEETLPPAATAAPAAVVTAMTACVWQGSEKDGLQVGDPVKSGGKIELIEGIAEVRLNGPADSASLLRIEGPASVVFGDGGDPSLRYGKMIVDNTYSGTQTEIKTSIGKVVVERNSLSGLASFNAKVTIHVFRGAANFTKPAYADRDHRLHEFTAGESGFVLSNAKGHKVTIGKADPNLFAASRSMGLEVLRAPERYVESVLKSKPIAYWRFEEHEQGVIKNEVSDDFVCNATGLVRLVGPKANRSIEFEASDRTTMLRVNQSFDDVIDEEYSLECWMKPSHYHRGTMLAMVDIDQDSSDPARQVKQSLLLELYSIDISPTTLAHPGRVRFLLRTPPARNRELGTSCFSSSPYRLRRWQHVVAAKKGAEMKLYVNGNLTGIAAHPESLPKGLTMLIGRQELGGWSRGFVGQLDEMAVYDRALTREEAERHYEAIKVRHTQPDMI
ncbi:hypothetical protein MalM25_21700 [Planctomycetes bacterium MalM25]|nr:hypothetical protein MalM25_21700 [Planctomycetes bacterium MalM25]